MPLIEVIEGDDTSQETVTAALNFAQAIKKQPIACAEVPGFVVNRILNSGIAEIWREQEEKGLSIKAIDEGVGAANVTPMGPYFLINLLGLDTVLHVAEHLRDVLRRPLLRPRGHAAARRRRQARRQDRRRGLLHTTASRTSPATREPDVEELVELLTLKTLRRGVPGARGGRRDPPRHRRRR